MIVLGIVDILQVFSHVLRWFVGIKLLDKGPRWFLGLCDMFGQFASGTHPGLFLQVQVPFSLPIRFPAMHNALIQKQIDHPSFQDIGFLPGNQLILHILYNMIEVILSLNQKNT